jgi:archaellum biogenesis ATPase FlaH
MYDAITTMDPGTSGGKSIGAILGGGIQPGSLVIIEGESRSGKSILCQHMAYGALMSGNLATYYATDQTREELIHQMESFNMRLLRIYSLVASLSNQGTDVIRDDLMNHINCLPRRFSLIVLDNLTPFMTNMKPNSKADMVLAFKELCGKNRSIVLVVHTHILEKSTQFRIMAMSNYYLKISSGDKIILPGVIDERNIKTLEAWKLHGVELPRKQMVEFQIKPRVGIQVLPFCKVKV